MPLYYFSFAEFSWLVSLVYSFHVNCRLSESTSKKTKQKTKQTKKTPQKPHNIFFIDRKLNIKVHLEKIHILTPVNLLLGELGMHFYLLFSLCFVFTVTVRVDAL